MVSSTLKTSLYGPKDGHGTVIGETVRIPPKMPLDFPTMFQRIEKGHSQRYSLKDLLQFKDKITDGYMAVSIVCGRDLDTTYKFNFRAKIIGECESADRIQEK